MATLTDRQGSGPPRPATGRLRIDPAGPAQRRPRPTWIALGVLVLLGFGLVGAVTVARAADRTPVLALAQPIERGEELTAGHLTVANVGADETVAVVAAADRDELVGLMAAGSLEEGTLITRGQFVAGPSVGPGQSVVGLALAPGEYPTANLRPGDRVVVVRTPASTGPLDRAGQEPAVLAEGAEVFAVEALSDTARTLMVSITVPDTVAAAAAGRIRLLLVDRL